MRKKLLNVGAYKTAKRRAPWAAVIAQVDGGWFLAFESVDEYKSWKAQK